MCLDTPSPRGRGQSEPQRARVRGYQMQLCYSPWVLLRTVRTPQRTVSFARSLRTSSNAAERKLWKRLQNRKVMNRKFRRQVPIGPYIADFLCADAKLILEIDGDSHYEDGAQERDRKRDAFLQERGCIVIRLSNRAPHPNPLPRGEGTLPLTLALSRGEREHGPSP